MITFQFPFHRDRLCNLQNHELPLHELYYVSIPFSSGQALQFPQLAWRLTKPFFLFQFPFHRDRLCNRRDNQSIPGRKCSVSIPFSSGQALQSQRLEHSSKSASWVSIPFSSGQALQFSKTSRETSLRTLFQFPFHRDRLCNARQRQGDRQNDRPVSIPFSSGQALQCIKWLRSITSLPNSFNSLFIGIGSAIKESSSVRGSLSSRFNSLFIGIGSAMYRAAPSRY